MRRYRLEFRPTDHRRRERTQGILGGFAALLLLAAVVSVMVLRRDGLLDKIFNIYVEPTLKSEEESGDVWSFSGNLTILLAETDPSQELLRFCMLAHLNGAEKKLQLIPLSPRTKVELDGKIWTLTEALRHGGPGFLQTAVSQTSGHEVARYLASDDAGFIKAVNFMGSVMVQLPERVRYQSEEFGISLSQGNQRLQGEQLLRYFRYLGTISPIAQADLMRRLLTEYFGKNLRPDQFESHFHQLANFLTSDISVTDFFEARNLLEIFLKENQNFQIEVLES